jgi:hypothetical protein
MAWLEGGQYSMSFAGNPGQSYALQFTESLTSPAWQTLVIITADSTTGLGSYVMTPSTNAPRQFHRLITPPP